MRSLKLQNPIIKGVFFSIMGTALFAPLFATGKYMDGAIPAMAFMGMRYMGGFLTVCVVIMISGTKSSSLKSPKPSQHLLRACLGIGGGACMIHAATQMPIADATAIGLTKGLIVVALAALILRERVTFRHWLAGCVCACGAYIVISGSLSLDTLGYAATEGIIAALAGALFMSFEVLLLKVLARRENALGVLVYVNGFGALLLIIPTVYLQQYGGFTWSQLLPFLLLGPLAIAGQFCNIIGYRYGDVVVLGPINYTWIIFATAIGVLVFNEIPDVSTLVGATFIVAGGIGLIRLSSKPVINAPNLAAKA